MSGNAGSIPAARFTSLLVLSVEAAHHECEGWLRPPPATPRRRTHNTGTLVATHMPLPNRHSPLAATLAPARGFVGGLHRSGGSPREETPPFTLQAVGEAEHEVATAEYVGESRARRTAWRDELRRVIAGDTPARWALFVAHDSGRMELHSADGDAIFVMRVDEARREVRDRLLIERDATCVEATEAGLELVAICSRCESA